MDKKVLILGGTGIVGKPITLKALQDGYKPYVVSLEKELLPKEVEQIVLDRSSSEFKGIIEKLNKEVGQWEAVIDVFTFDEVSAYETHKHFREIAKHFITISTTLVYDRSKENIQPISEDNTLAPPGKFGGYVDGKVRLEKFWEGIKDVPWTIIRPYHVLGKNSYLGCIPETNRDPELIEKIRNGKPLKLCEEGRVRFNYVHPEDIAEAVSRITGNKKTHFEAYNVVNPKTILAKEYYEEIAKQTNGSVNIENVSIEQIWKELKGWEMTTFPHIYDTNKLKKDTEFTPRIPLEKAIEDAITYAPQENIKKDKLPIHQRMNKLPRPEMPDWLRTYYE